MSCICIIDTSIFLNMLNVEGRNQAAAQVTEDFKTYVKNEATFILPMATIIETGNHIAQNGDGGTRRKTAERFCKSVTGAFKGDAPYQPSDFPNKAEILTWIDGFPTVAGQNKTPQKTTEGTSFGDLSIIEEFNKAVKRTHRMSEVFIWSLDSDLKQYHHQPSTA